MTLTEFRNVAAGRLTAVCDDEREANNIVSLLVEEILGHKKTVHQNCTIVITGEQQAVLLDILVRLETNEPVQYVLGVSDFFGRRFKVNQHVLIPRPETEEMVDIAIKAIKKKISKRARMLDIGTGSGCIAITIKKELPYADVIGIDVSADAIGVAKENDRILNAGVCFIDTDFLNKKKWDELGLFDSIISNPPYITHEEFSELMPRVKNFEPALALIAQDTDPFIFYRTIAAFGMRHLSPEGFVMVELNSTHVIEIASIFKEQRYKQVKVMKDLQGNDRILEARIN